MSVSRCSRQLLQRSVQSFPITAPPRLQLNSQILKSFAKQLTTTSSCCNPPQSTEGPKTILYSYWHSSCSWRVRIALNFKAIPYQTRAINLNGEQHGEEYRVVNPMQQVPTLLIDGHSIIESVAIMHYLEETRPQPPLLPPEPYKRAKVREVVDIICSGIQPLQNSIVRRYVGKEKQREWAHHWIQRGFRALEKVLTHSAGQYSVGNEISMADCCLLPQVFNAKALKMDMSGFPIISRIASDLETMPAFFAAHPTNQPDFPSASVKQ